MLTFISQAGLLDGDGTVKSESIVENFGIQDFDVISSLKADVSEKALRYDNVFVKERIESKANKVKQKTAKRKKQAGLFGGFSLKKGLFSIFGSGEKRIEYIDFVNFQKNFENFKFFFCKFFVE